MQLQVKNAQKSKNNSFRPKRTTNKASCKIFRGFELGKNVLRGFSKPKEQNQMLMEHFEPLKTNNNVCLVYLQCKLQEDKRS